MFKKNNKRKNKKKFNNSNSNNNNNNSTFDPRIHHRSHGSSGYGMKRDHVQTEEETSGKQLAHMFDKWKKN